MQLLIDIFAGMSAYVGKGPHFCQTALTVWGVLKEILMHLHCCMYS